MDKDAKILIDPMLLDTDTDTYVLNGLLIGRPQREQIRAHFTEKNEATNALLYQHPNILTICILIG